MLLSACGLLIKSTPPPPLYSPQNFFQIISNLLEEENKEKWEDAQKVSTAPCASVIRFACIRKPGRAGSGCVLAVSQWRKTDPDATAGRETGHFHGFVMSLPQKATWWQQHCQKQQHPIHRCDSFTDTRSTSAVRSLTCLFY